MRKGQIVRKMSNDGTPYGAYLIIDRATNKYIDAHPIDPVTNVTVTLDKNHVYECKVGILDAPYRDIIKIVENNPSTYYHEPTDQWLKASSYDWDIVVLKNNATRLKVFFDNTKVERIMKRRTCTNTNMSAFIPTIRLTFGRLIHAIIPK